MNPSQLEIKISTDVKLDQLRAMEAQLAKQVVQLRTLGDTGTTSLKSVEANLAAVRGELGKINMLEKGYATLGETFKQLPVVGAAMNTFNGSAGVIGATLAAGTIAAREFFKALNFADNLQDVSEQLGVSASALQTLNAHFGDAGIKAPQVAALLQKLQDSLSRGAAGDPTMVKAFAALGLSITELRSMSPDQALATYGAALARVGTQAEGAAANLNILGQSTGRQAAALKDLGEKGMPAAQQAMTAAGRVIEDEMVKRLADANQKLEELDQRWTIFKASVAAGLLTPSSGSDWRRPKTSSAVAPLADRALQPTLTEAQLSEGISPRLAADQRDKIIAERRAANAAAEAANAPILAARLARAAEAAKAEEAAKAAVAKEAADQRAAVALKAQDELDETLRLAAVANLKQQIEQGNALYLKDQEQRKKDAEAAVVRERALAQQALADQIAASNAAIAALDDNKLITQEFRDREKIRILAEQNRAIAEQIAKLKELDLLDLKGGDPTRQNQIRDLSGKRVENDSKIAEATPMSAGDGALAGAVGYISSIPDAAARAQQAVMSLAQSMEQGIGGSIRGLIDGTMTWTTALANIGNAIIQGIINSFVGMVAQWITQQIVMAVAGKAIQAAQLAALAPLALASAALWMPAATAATIATLGSAAITGSVMARTAVMTSAIGFAEGGPVSGPGTGTSDSIPAWLSNGEYVMPAAETAKYRPLLDSMRDGTLGTPSSSGVASLSAPSAGGGGSVVVNNSFATGVTRAEVAALIPEIERRTLAAVADRSRRGKA